MKAMIDVEGVLIVYPESEIEAWALKMWSTNYGRPGSVFPTALSIRFDETDFYKDGEK